MGEVSTIGLDIAKSVFQVHGVDAGGAVVIRKRISRAKLLEFFASLPACLVGIEACPTADYWSRQLQALGHTVCDYPAHSGFTFQYSDSQNRCENRARAKDLADDPDRFLEAPDSEVARAARQLE
jgi:transposase